MNVTVLYSDRRHVSATHVAVFSVVSARIRSVVHLNGFKCGMTRHAIHICVFLHLLP